jgi:hypothetical protein
VVVNVHGVGAAPRAVAPSAHHPHRHAPGATPVRAVVCRRLRRPTARPGHRNRGATCRLDGWRYAAPTPGVTTRKPEALRRVICAEKVDNRATETPQQHSSDHNTALHLAATDWTRRPYNTHDTRCQSLSQLGPANAGNKQTALSNQSCPRPLQHTRAHTTAHTATHEHTATKSPRAACCNRRQLAPACARLATAPGATLVVCALLAWRA